MSTPCPATIEALGEVRSCGHVLEDHPKFHDADGIRWRDPESATVTRLRCNNCGRFMPPDVRYDESSFPPAKLPVEHYGYQGNDKFCTLRCGFQWAVTALRTQSPEQDSLHVEAICSICKAVVPLSREGNDLSWPANHGHAGELITYTVRAREIIHPTPRTQEDQDDAAGTDHWDFGGES